MSLPESLGRLRRVRRLGVGGFATVWLYYDQDLHSEVAVKALAENWAQRIDIRERFLEEARILRRADSDHVVRVYDIGEAGDTPYFVMTYADRGTVADLLASGVPITLETAVDVVRQAGMGLTRLHSQGVIHRDVKPANLLLRSDGSSDPTTPGYRVLVTDLGVAKAMLHASGLTQVVGTPGYMAPEQVSGGGVDERADVHALGAVAYHLLTGRLIRDGVIGDLLASPLPAPPSAFGPLSPSVDEIVMRAIAPDREQRWPSVAEFCTALHHATAGQTQVLPTRQPAAVGGRHASPHPAAPHVSGTPWAPSPPPQPEGRRADQGPQSSWRWLLLVFLVVFGVAATASFLLARASG